MKWHFLKMKKGKVVENFLKATYFNYPEWIPSSVRFLPATWRKYGKKLEEIVLRHPKIFPNYEKGKQDFDALPEDPLFCKGEFVDSWGCGWRNTMEGLHAGLIYSPLQKWEFLDTYKPPDPLLQDPWDPKKKPDWKNIEKNINKAKKEGNLAIGGLAHGFMYMRLYYLRGFENLMVDVAMDEPHLNRLIEMVLDYNTRIIEKYLQMNVEFLFFGDDLGLQRSLPMSPQKFRKYLKPSYEKMFGICKEKGVGVHLHSDGCIIEIIDDLIEVGVDIIDFQIRANTLKDLEEVARGKICIDLDLDRQLFPFAPPEQIKAHIKEAVDRLALQKGGLMVHAECGPDVPLENIETICETLEKIGGPFI